MGGNAPRIKTIARDGVIPREGGRVDLRRHGSSGALKETDWLVKKIRPGGEVKTERHGEISERKSLSGEEGQCIGGILGGSSLSKEPSGVWGKNLN